MIIKNSVYNLVGLALPMLVAMLTIPILINILGNERFGLLTLIWAVVSYFGLFDLGISRALTIALAPAFIKKQNRLINSIFITSMIVMIILGVISTLIMMSISDWFASTIENAEIQKEFYNSLIIMAISIPLIIISNGFRGTLEANFNFKIVNLIRLPLGIYTFIAPLMVITYYQNKLDAITLALVVGRVLASVIYGIYVYKILPNYKIRIKDINIIILKKILSLGGWVTVTNLISPFMGYIDRFVIGILLSSVAVTYYVTPNELITKLWIIPGAITGVLLPVFATQSRENISKLYTQSVIIVYMAMLSASMIFYLFPNQILEFWVGIDISTNSQEILKILSIGIIINSIAHIPYTLLQSINKAKTTAIIHICELPFFLIILFVLIEKYGLIGAAYSWLIRMCIDTFCMFYFSKNYINMKEKHLTKNAFLIIVCTVTYLAVDYIENLSVKILLYILITTGIIFFIIKNKILSRN